MQRRLLYVGVGAVAVVAAVALLRSQTPTVESVVAPDGQQLTATHDPGRVEPPSRPEAGNLHHELGDGHRGERAVERDDRRTCAAEIPARHAIDLLLLASLALGRQA